MKREEVVTEEKSSVFNHWQPLYQYARFSLLFFPFRLFLSVSLHFRHVLYCIPKCVFFFASHFQLQDGT